MGSANDGTGAAADAGPLPDTGTVPLPGTGSARLDVVFEALSALIERWRPDAVAVERIFYKMNARTLVPVAQASGVALLVAARAGTDVYEYAPLEVKLAVVGTGSASKDQMRFMVARLLSGSFRTETPDAADALAVAICHIHSRKVRALGGAPR